MAPADLAASLCPSFVAQAAASEAERVVVRLQRGPVGLRRRRLDEGLQLTWITPHASDGGTDRGLTLAGSTLFSPISQRRRSRAKAAGALAGFYGYLDLSRLSADVLLRKVPTGR
jgi:hypothetical protein